MNHDVDQSLNEEKQKPTRAPWKRRLSHAYQHSTRWGQRHIPPGLRSVLGVLFVVGGVFGFLPILGFWMVPLGISLLALDFPPLQRRLELWLGHAGGVRRDDDRHN